LANEVKAALFDLRAAMLNAAALASSMAEQSPFLPLIFLQSGGFDVPESTDGLRYYVDSDHLDDLQHILISLGFGFLAETFEAELPEMPRRVPRVLIVDDNVQLASLIGRSLRSMERFDVRVATSAYEAAAILPAFHPDVAIIDMVLGDMDGRKVCSYIRQQDSPNRTHILGVSGYLPESRLSEEPAFDDFLEKPFRVRDVIARIMPYLTRAA
jgi:CheY-like chemotaxis protein